MTTPWEAMSIQPRAIPMLGRSLTGTFLVTSHVLVGCLPKDPWMCPYVSCQRSDPHIEIVCILFPQCGFVESDAIGFKKAVTHQADSAANARETRVLALVRRVSCLREDSTANWSQHGWYIPLVNHELYVVTASWARDSAPIVGQSLHRTGHAPPERRSGVAFSVGR